MYLSAPTPRQFPTRRASQRKRTRTVQQLSGLASGRVGIRDTLAYMRSFADQYKTHPSIRELALTLTRNLPQKDYAGEVAALWDYVKNNIRYVRDIVGVETIQTPLKTLEYGQGDCDDKATLLSSMLESLGHKTRFRAIGVNGSPLCHVLVEVNRAGQWVPLETTEPVGIGWLPPNITDNMIEGVDGLGSLWGSIKSGLAKVDSVIRHNDPVVKAVNKEIAKPGVQKVLGAVGSVLTFFPPTTAIGLGLVAVAKGAEIHAAQTAQIKMKKALEAKKANDAAALAELDKVRYVIDSKTGEMREATPSDVGVQLYKFNAETGQAEPVAGQQTPVNTFLNAVRGLFDYYNARGYSDDQAGAALRAATAAGVGTSWKNPGDPTYVFMDNWLAKNYPVKGTASPALAQVSKWAIPAALAAATIFVAGQ